MAKNLARCKPNSVLDVVCHNQISSSSHPSGSGELEFNEFCTLAAKFLEEEEENPEAMRAELREAFMLYDREGESRG